MSNLEKAFLSVLESDFKQSKSKLDDPFLKMLQFETIENPNNKNILEKKESKSDTDQVQVRNKLGTDQVQVRNKLDTDRVQVRNKLGTKSGTDQVQVRNKLGTKLNPRLEIDELDTIDVINRLSETKFKIIKYIINRCIYLGDLSTGALNLNVISDELYIKKSVLKSRINELVKSGLIFRDKGKSGPSGFYRLSISKKLRNSFLEINRSTNQSKSNQVQVRNKLGTKSGTSQVLNQVQFTSSSSSNNIFNNKNKTTNSQPEETFQEQTIFELPPKWMAISFFGLNEKIKFGMGQLKQIAKKGVLTPEQVENSLEQFAHDIEKGLVRAKKSLLGMVMGIFLNGQEYVSVDETFKSDTDLFLEQQLNAKLAKQKQHLAKIEELKNNSFEIWNQTLSPDAKKAILEGLNIFQLEKLNDSGKLAHLKGYYEDTLWPKELEKMRKKVRIE